MNKKILTLFAGAAIFILAGCVPGDFEWIQATATAAAESGVDTAEQTSHHSHPPQPTVTRPTDSPVPAATKTADTEPYPSPFTPTPMTPGYP
jgi:hypothetical protein